MSVFKGNCPYCGTKNVAFALVHEWRPTKEESPIWDTLAYCGQCSRGVLATFRTPDGNGPIRWLSSAMRHRMPAPTIFPSAPDIGAPEHTPSNVARFYEQGMDNMPGNWDAAGSMFRKALEAGLKNRFPEIKGTLYERIEKAAKQHKLTPDLAEWAHQIRLGGKNAVHEEEPFSKEEAEQLSTFTKLVLLYLFTLPGMLEQARNTPPDDSGNQ